MENGLSLVLGTRYTYRKAAHYFVGVIIMTSVVILDIQQDAVHNFIIAIGMRIVGKNIVL